MLHIEPRDSLAGVVHERTFASKMDLAHSEVDLAQILAVVVVELGVRVSGGLELIAVFLPELDPRLVLGLHQLMDGRPVRHDLAILLLPNCVKAGFQFAIIHVLYGRPVPLVGFCCGRDLPDGIDSDAYLLGNLPQAHCRAAVEMQYLPIGLSLHGCTLREPAPAIRRTSKAGVVRRNRNRGTERPRSPRLRTGSRLDRLGFGDKTEDSRGFTSTAAKSLWDGCPGGFFLSAPHCVGYTHGR